MVIAGGSSDTNEFMDYIKEKAKNDDRFIFTGFVQGKVLEDLYSNSYLYVLPSDLEGMPISLLEAMSYGNCCIVSDIPECVEVVEDKGLVFKKGSVEDLRRILQNCISDVSKTQKYKREAARFITNKYNWNEVVTQTVELYRR